MSSKPPHIKPAILKHSQLWAPHLHFFTVAEAYCTLQTISAVFYTAQETYLSKKNTAVVILASVCSPSRLGAVEEEKWMEEEIWPEPLKILIHRWYFQMVWLIPQPFWAAGKAFL